MGFKWTDASVAALRKHAADNMPASGIAAKLGCSRNAVIGKARRLGVRLNGGKGGRPAAGRPASGRLKGSNGSPAARRKDALNRATSAGGALDELIDKMGTRAPADDPEPVLRENRRPIFARPITCQDVARHAPIAEITRAVRKGDLPDDAKPTAFDAIDNCQCRWPVGAYDASACGWSATTACGAPVIDTASRYTMARTHCAFHFRAMGQNLEKVLAR